MVRTILYIMTVVLLLTIPGNMNAQDIQKQNTTEIEKDTKSVSITIITPNTIKIKNAEGTVAVIYDVAGKAVTKFRVDSSEKIYPLDSLEKGIYIVKVGKQIARKIVIK